MPRVDLLHVRAKPEKKKLGRPKMAKPIGRPKGSKNLKTLAKEQMVNTLEGLAEKDVKEVYAVLIAKIKDGNDAALKLYLDRIWPALKAADASENKSTPKVVISFGELQPKAITVDDSIIAEVPKK